MGDVLTVEQARAAGIGASYPDDAEGNAMLDERIRAAERWLESRIGPLLGPVREEHLNVNGGARVWLKRPAKVDTLAVTLDAVAVASADVFVTHTRELTRTDTELWWGRFVATYMPDDELQVREALLSLARLEVTESGMQSETISGSSYAYTRGDGKLATSSRAEVLAGLLRPGATIGL